MNRLLKSYRNWRYRRLYRRLFWFYATHDDPKLAGENAAIAFEWLSAFEYKDLFKGHRKPDV